MTFGFVLSYHPFFGVDKQWSGVCPLSHYSTCTISDGSDLGVGFGDQVDGTRDVLIYYIVAKGFLNALVNYHYIV